MKSLAGFDRDGHGFDAAIVDLNRDPFLHELDRDQEPIGSLASDDMTFQPGKQPLTNADPLTGQETLLDRQRLAGGNHLPDLQEIFFTRRTPGGSDDRIWTSRLENGTLTTPELEEEMLAVLDSWNLIEISVNGGRAADRFPSDPPLVVEITSEPGSTFLEKDGTFTNAERRINRVRKVMAPRNGYADWEITQMLANALGAGWTYTHPSQIMEEIAFTTPSLSSSAGGGGAHFTG